MGVASLLQVVVCIILIMFPFTAVYADFQVEALTKFKEALQDPKRKTQTWDAQFDNPCSWYLIDCNPQNNLVIKVNLGLTGISGHLSPYLGNLSGLQYLNLYGNSLTGPIPPELGKLKNLQKNGIQLQDNKLSGRVPDSVAKLGSGVVNVSGNKDLCGTFTTKPQC